MVERRDYSQFRLGDWEVSPGTCTLQRLDQEVKVTPRSMDVLVYLAHNASQVVSSAELLDQLWETTTSDHAVHKAIAELRHALGDDSHNQHFIKTIPRRGYSLLVEPHWPEPQNRVSIATGPHARLTSHSAWAATALAAVSVVLLALWNPFAASTVQTDAQAERVTLGILPFTTDAATMDTSQFLVDGLTASLLSGLSKLSEMAVYPLPHNSEYSLATHTVQELGVKSGVGHLVDGTLFQANGQLRLVVHLFRTADGAQLYSQQFDLPAADIFEIQDSIVSNLITALSIHLDDKQRSNMLDWGTSNALAYEQFMKGEFYNNQFNPADFQRAIKHHQAAITLDPGFMKAYLGLATAANNLAVYSRTENIESLREVIAEAHRAVASIDRDSEELDAIRAMELRMSGGNYREEESILRQQILSGNPPDFALAHYALFLIGARMFDEARMYLDRVSETDPFDISPDEIWSYRLNIQTPEEEVSSRRLLLQERPNHIGTLGVLARNLMFTGEYEEALAFANRQKQLDTELITAHFSQVVIGVLTDRLYPGSKEVEESYRLGPDFNFNNGTLAFMLGDVNTGAAFWRALRPTQKRRLVNLVYATEKFYSNEVLASEQYQALLEELDVGLSWQRTLMEGVMAMEPITGVALNKKSREAYEQGYFMGRNNLWTEAQWQTLERQIYNAKTRFLHCLECTKSARQDLKPGL